MPQVWWSFGITSGVYWVGGLVYMALDMWSPAFLQPYKLQAGVITWGQYRQVCTIVLRNQLLVALPLLVAIATFRPLETSLPLPGVGKSIGTFLFCLACEEVGCVSSLPR